ncbi:MAG: hypothetical protein NT082_03500 [Chloroflexi bacterium]|nr:hypothetical protein [Chloroflexota bacterium]
MSLEKDIKDFAVNAGASLVGIAGRERLIGPPSIDPNYVLRGAKSVMALALPMNVPAIYDFLDKTSSGPHNIDQARMNQRMHRISKELADYIVSLGYKAVAVPPNNTYRRALDPFSTRPSFSHRFAAVLAGLGTFGLSGNVITKEYGAAVYLGSVVTNAVLKSDPVLPARYAMDNRCRTCKLCDKTCTLSMFRDDEEEHLLLNGELHARGKRNNLDFCNLSCFGLHSISKDKKWSNWGRHWINDYIDSQPDPDKRQEVRAVLMRQGSMAGDSTPRFEVIRRIGKNLWPRHYIEDYLPDYDNLSKNEDEIFKLLVKYEENVGVVGLKDPYVLTCGQCALVCGPDFEETKKRYDLLTSSGYVVPGLNGNMVNVKTLDEALEMKAKYPPRVTRQQKMKDARDSGAVWMKSYFGFEPIEEFKNWLYQLKNKKACAQAGLAGKEASAPILVYPRYLKAFLSKPNKKKP